jgi:Tol biopolymer transport system component
MRTRASICILIAAVSLGFTSCKSNPQKSSPLPVVSEPVRPVTETASVSTVVPTAPTVTLGSAVARPLTSSGDNTGAHFSPTGSRILFISRDRPSHRQAQVYELDLARMIERRLTFHDGDDSDADYFPDARAFLYSSPTDELKEEPALVENLRSTYLAKTQKPNQGYAPTEIYMQTTDGRVQERLTHSPGYDADASLDPEGVHAVFVSTRAGSPSLYVMNVRTGATQALTKTDGADATARFSPDGKYLVWVRYSKDHATAQLMLAQLKQSQANKNISANSLIATELTKSTALDLYPAWHPQGKEIIFASTRGGGTGFDLYSIDIEGKCLKRLTSGPGDKTQPTLNGDASKLAFTYNQGGKHQIYVTDFKPATECLP